MCRPRVQSSTSRSRRAILRMPSRSWRRWPPTATRRCGLRPSPRQPRGSEAGTRSGCRLRRHVRQLQLLDDRVALVHGEEIVAGLDQLVAALVEEGAQMLAAGLARFDQEDRFTARDRLLRAVEGLELHALEVELDEIDARQGH